MKNIRPIDLWDIPFPKTIAELAALDSTRSVPYLKSLCNRRHIQTPGQNPTPSEIIPIIEQRLRDHEQHRPDLRYNSDLATEWTAIQSDLHEFLTQLKQLLPPLTPSSVLSAPSATSVLPSIACLQPGAPASAETSKTAIPHQSAIRDPKSAITKTSGHFNKSNSPTSKTPAISTKASQPPKTLGHFNNSPQKISPPPQPSENLQSPMINDQSSMTPSQSPIPDPQSAIKSRPRRIHPILSRLTRDQKEKLVALYEQHNSLDASRLAAEKYGIQISSSSLQRLYADWKIKEDNDTRTDLETANNTSIEALTEKQLQLRLLELASRANMDHTELRAICHSFARLQSVKLSERRVQLAEAKEARLAQQNEPLRDFSDEETLRGLRAMMGKDLEDGDNSDALTCDDEPSNQPRGSRGDEALTFDQTDTSETTAEVGPTVPSGPRADDTLPNTQPASSVPATAQNKTPSP